MTNDERPGPASLSEHLCATGPAPRTSGRYRFAMALAAAVLIALPLLYVALVAAVGWGAVWWATEAGAFVGNGTDGLRGTSFVVARFGPTLVGAVTFLALLKPLVAKPAKHGEPVTLSREDEPLLHAYAERVAELVGAPAPVRIDVDLQVNASASFARGWRSLASDELVLTLGLPLVGGFDVRQLTAVVAHEFGHFAQGAGMRSSFLIATVQHWLARVVYERDRFDERLDRWASATGQPIVMIPLHAARGGVWLSRKVLLGLLHLGQAVVSALSRQMEFDADAQAFRIAGSESFCQTMALLPVLDRANDGAFYDVNTGYQEGRLGDDWVELVRANVRTMPDELRDSVLAEAMDGRPHMYASHPPTGQRCARAEAAALPSGVGLDAPTEVLFADFHALSRRLTLELYRDNLGERFRESLLVPSAQLNERVETELRFQKAAGEALEGRWSGSIRLRLGTVDLEGEPATTPAAAREAEVAARAHYDRELEAMGEEDAVLRQQRCGLVLRMGGLTFKDSLFELDATCALQDDAARVADAERFNARLDPHAEALRARCQTALRYLARDDVRSRVDDADGLLERARAGLEALDGLGSVAARVHELWRAVDVLERVGPVLSEHAKDAKAQQAMQLAVDDVRTAYEGVMAELEQRPYPFEHGEGEVSFARAMLPQPLADGAEPQAIHEAGERLHMRTTALQVRAVGQVLEAVLAAEAAFDSETANRAA